MLSNSFKFNMKSVVRFILLTIVVIYLLDAGVEASRSRKRGNKNRRSKRTHGDKERRRSRETDFETEVEIIDAVPSQPTLIELVKAQQQLRRHKTKVEPLVVLDENIHDGIQSTLIKEFLKNRLKNQPSVEDDRATILPVIHANADFLIKREKSPFFYESSTATIGGIDPAELGLVSVHTARGKYGLHSSSQRIFGRLIHVQDAGRSNSHFGCGNAIANRREIPQNNEPWIALIERGHCAFFTKIKLAERNNASAAIIYDSKQEGIPKMNTIGTKIVSIAISKHDGHKIARLTDSGTKVMVNIEVNTSPDIATKPDTATSATYLYQLDRVHSDDTRNDATTNNGVIITTLLTALLAALLQNMTS